MFTAVISLIVVPVKKLPPVGCDGRCVCCHQTIFIPENLRGYLDGKYAKVMLWHCPCTSDLDVIIEKSDSSVLRRCLEFTSRTVTRLWRAAANLRIAGPSSQARRIL